MIQHLSILFEDPFCLAVVKPAGQFTQGTWAPPGEETLEQAVRRHLNPDDPASAYVGIVHRLDRPVSGLLLWAKTSKAARRLSKQFEARQVVKEYLAIVEVSNAGSHDELWRNAEGSWDSVSAARDLLTWEDWLTPAGPDGRVRIVPPHTPNSRIAKTSIQSRGLAPGQSDLAGLRMLPHTGRTHQLRVQAASRGLPILGDTIYGGVQSFGEGIALHARSLKLRHPMDQSELSLQADLPQAWLDYPIDWAPCSPRSGESPQPPRLSPR